jgi:hypothetical protein
VLLTVLLQQVSENALHTNARSFAYDTVLKSAAERTTDLRRVKIQRGLQVQMRPRP